MKRLIFLIVSIVICNISFSQNLFQKTYNGSGYEAFYDIVKTSNGYITVGTTTSFGAGQNDILVIRTDIDGDTIWSKSFGGFYNDVAYAVHALSDSNFLVAGYTSSFSNYTNDPSNLYILKIDINGNLLWSVSYGGPNKDYAKNIFETTNNNYIIIGSTESIGAGGSDIYLLEIDTDGNFNWSKSLGGDQNDFGNDIIELGDKGFLITGNTTSFSFNGYVPYVLKVDSIGNYKWAKVYNFSGTINPENESNSITRGYYNDFLVVGSRGDCGIGDAQHSVMDIDSLGSLNWAKTYLMNSGNCHGYSIEKNSEGGFIVGGWIGNNYPAVMKIDAIGQRIWSRYYSAPPSTSLNYGRGYKTIEAHGGGYITSGMRNSYGTGDTLAVIFRTDIDGEFNCLCSSTYSTQTSSLSMSISSQVFTSSQASISFIDTCVINSAPENVTTYCLSVGIEKENILYKTTINPNPFNNTLSIVSCSNEISEIRIYDIMSRIVYKELYIGSALINTEQFEKGVYIYSIENKNSTIKKGKLIKE